MPLPPITTELTKFEHLEILRQELEDREQELKDTEKHIRQVLWELERQNYLKSLHGFYGQLQPPPEAAQLSQTLAYREALGEVLELIKAQVLQIEAETKGQKAPPPRALPRPGAPAAGAGGAGAAGAAGQRKIRFDSFEAFKSQRPDPPPGKTP